MKYSCNKNETKLKITIYLNRVFENNIMVKFIEK